MADSLYRVMLGRRPTVAERSSMALRLQIPNQFESILSHMLDSPEFQTMGLPLKLADATKEWTGNRVFFLHIPKTAGTSVRLALIDAVGTPAFEFYDRNPKVEASWRESNYNFWPLWVGHQNIADFPQELNGLTIFRESRSRLLSTYRQKNREAIADNPHMLDEVRLAVEKNHSLQILNTPFHIWLNNPVGGEMIDYFVSSKSFGPGSMNSKEFKDYVNGLNEPALETALNESLGRITHAAWAHDGPAILRAISGVSGSNVTELPRENVYESQKEFIPQILNKDTVATLNAIQEKETLVYKAAHEQGLVPLLSKSEADDLFEITAKRLGFTFT